MWTSTNLYNLSKPSSFFLYYLSGKQWVQSQFDLFIVARKSGFCVCCVRMKNMWVLITWHLIGQPWNLTGEASTNGQSVTMKMVHQSVSIVPVNSFLWIIALILKTTIYCFWSFFICAKETYDCIVPRISFLTETALCCLLSAVQLFLVIAHHRMKGSTCMTQ